MVQQDTVHVPGQSLGLPDGACLLHIGPPKTGTSSLQGSLHAVRPQLATQGVHYAGRGRHSLSAVHAVLGRKGFFSDGAGVDIAVWEKLIKDTNKPKARLVVLSSEGFASARPDQLGRIVDDLGRARVHVVVTLRPLAKLVPSQWQQYVQSGVNASFPKWLEQMFSGGQATVTPSFWLRHRHDELVRHWAEQVGSERVTVVAVDDGDHTMLLRTFEAMCGLSAGTLVAQPDRFNRSLTVPEIEAVRALNVLIKQEGLPPSAQARLVHFGAASYLKRFDPDPTHQKVVTPLWAAERIHEISREMVANLKVSGVRIVGDLDRMVAPIGDPPREIPETVDVPPVVAARLALGIAFATDAVRRVGPGVPDDRSGEPAGLQGVPTAAIGKVLADRVRAAGARRLDATRARVMPAGTSDDVDGRERK